MLDGTDGDFPVFLKGDSRRLYFRVLLLLPELLVARVKILRPGVVTEDVLQDVDKFYRVGVGRGAPDLNVDLLRVLK